MLSSFWLMFAGSVAFDWLYRELQMLGVRMKPQLASLGFMSE